MISYILRVILDMTVTAVKHENEIANLRREVNEARKWACDADTEAKRVRHDAEQMVLRHENGKLHI